MESLIPQDIITLYLRDDSYATTEEEHETAIDWAYERLHWKFGAGWAAKYFRDIETELTIARNQVAALLEEATNGQ